MTLGEAYDALTKARADYARALLAIKQDSADDRAQVMQREAVHKGRAAWGRYQLVAAAGLAERIRGVIPEAFLDQGLLGKVGE